MRNGYQDGMSSLSLSTVYGVQSTIRRLRSYGFAEPATTPRFLNEEAVIIVQVDRSSRPSWST